MNRFLLSSLLVVSAALGLAVDISFETRATTVDKALDALSAQNNVKIKAVGPIARQVVVIKVTKQPIEVFLKHLSTVLSASVTQRDGVIEVSENGNAIKAEEDAERARAAKQFAKSIAEQTKEINAPSLSEDEFHKSLTELKRLMEQVRNNPDDPDGKLYEQTDRLRETMPTTLLVRRLVATIPPAELAAIQTDRRVVYATNPTRMQKPFNATAQKVLAQYATEYTRIASAINRFPKEQQEDFLGLIGTYQAKGAPTKVILGCTRYAGDNLAIEAQVLDNQGRVISSGSTSLVGSLQSEESAGTKAEEGAKNEKGLQVSEESKVYFALMSRGIEGGVGGIDVIQEPLRSKVLNPETHDPLSFGITDLLLGAAADRNQPMIVVLPDSAQTIDLNGSPKASDLFSQLRVSEQVIVDTVDGWLVGKPFHAADARNRRLSRSAYGNLVRSISKSGRVGLSDLTSFAMSQRVNPGYDSFYIMNLYALFGSAMAGYDLSAWEALKFYGYLGETTRKSMEGKFVAFGSLPRDAQDEIATLVYKQSSLGFNGAFEVPTDGTGDGTSMPCMDPTERLPNGIPGDAKVQVNTTIEAVVIPTTGFAYPMGAAELASTMAMQERPDLFPWAQENRIGEKFRTSTRSFYDFAFEFGQGASQAIQLWDFQGTSRDPITVAQLPAEFKTQYEASLKEMRESYKGMKPSDFRGNGRNGQPPPR